MKSLKNTHKNLWVTRSRFKMLTIKTDTRKIQWNQREGATDEQKN